MNKRTGFRLVAITNFNFATIDPPLSEAKKTKVRDLLPALKIIAMQHRQKLNRASNFKYCMAQLQKSIMEN